ncbi:MAG: CoA pyrophosphatase [Ignavibacteriaceae bacterium]
MAKPTIEEIQKKFETASDIIGKSKYINCAVLIPLIEIENRYHLLFQKRASGIRQGGEISFPGGEFNPAADITLEDTAIRESCEELGLTSDQISIIGKFGSLVAPMGLTIDAFAGLISYNNYKNMIIDKSEVESVFTIPLEYFMNTEPEIFYSRLEIHTTGIDSTGNSVELLPVKKLNLPEIYASPWRNGRYRVIVYNTGKYVLWGLTAEIVYEFCKLMKQN